MPARSLDVRSTARIAPFLIPLLAFLLAAAPLIRPARAGEESGTPEPEAARSGQLTPVSPERASRILSGLTTSFRRDRGLRSILSEFHVDILYEGVVRPPSNPHSNELSPPIRYTMESTLATRDESTFLHRVSNGTYEWKGLYENGRSLSLQTFLDSGRQAATVKFDKKLYEDAARELERIFPTFADRFPLTTRKTTFTVEGMTRIDDLPLVRVKVEHDPALEGDGYGYLYVEDSKGAPIRRVEVFGDKGVLLEESAFDRYTLVGSVVLLPLESTYKVYSVSWRGRTYVAFDEKRTVRKVTLGDPPVSPEIFRLRIPEDVTVQVIPDTGEPREPAYEKPEAPPLADGTWIGEDPGPLAALRGRVVLLEFLSRDSDETDDEKVITDARIQLARESGILVLGIHPPDDDPAAVQSYLEERGFSFPVMIDDPDPSRAGRGSTFAIYDATRTPDSFLIDENGKLIAGGGDVNEEAVRKAAGR